MDASSQPGSSSQPDVSDVEIKPHATRQTRRLDALPLSSNLSGGTDGLLPPAFSDSINMDLADSLPLKNKRTLAKKDKSGKPPFSYAALIGQAINSKPDKRISLNDIYNFICDHYSYYRKEDAGWQNSIRHNLSLNECFDKSGRTDDDAPGKGCLWVFVAGVEEQFANGGFTKRVGLKKGVNVNKGKQNAAKRAAEAKKLVAILDEPSTNEHELQLKRLSKYAFFDQMPGPLEEEKEDHPALEHDGSPAASTSSKASASASASQPATPTVNGKRSRSSTQKAKSAAKSQRVLERLDSLQPTDTSDAAGQAVDAEDVPDADYDEGIEIDLTKGVETRAAHRRKKSTTSVKRYTPDLTPSPPPNARRSPRRSNPRKSPVRKSGAIARSKQAVVDEESDHDEAMQGLEWEESSDDEEDRHAGFSYNSPMRSARHTADYIRSPFIGTPFSPSKLDALTSVAMLDSATAPPATRLVDDFARFTSTSPSNYITTGLGFPGEPSFAFGSPSMLGQPFFGTPAPQHSPVSSVRGAFDRPAESPRVADSTERSTFAFEPIGDVGDSRTIRALSSPPFSTHHGQRSDNDGPFPSPRRSSLPYDSGDTPSNDNAVRRSPPSGERTMSASKLLLEMAMSSPSRPDETQRTWDKINPFLEAPPQMSSSGASRDSRLSGSPGESPAKRRRLDGTSTFQSPAVGAYPVW